MSNEKFRLNIVFDCTHVAEVEAADAEDAIEIGYEVVAADLSGLCNHCAERYQLGDPTHITVYPGDTEITDDSITTATIKGLQDLCDHYAERYPLANAKMGVPYGWQLVPVDVTLEMQHAYFEVIDKNLHRIETDVRFGRYDNAKAGYRAMLAAAPKPSDTEVSGGNEKARLAAGSVICKSDKPMLRFCLANRDRIAANPTEDKE